jgi:uncharacterized protein with GYD domain
MVFFMFGRYSSESVGKISPKRTDQASALIKEAGGEAKAAYALLGDTDLVLIAEFPGVDQAIKASVKLSKLTGIAFSTSPAITVEEFDKLV